MGKSTALETLRYRGTTCQSCATALCTPGLLNCSCSSLASIPKPEISKKNITQTYLAGSASWEAPNGSKWCEMVSWALNNHRHLLAEGLCQEQSLSLVYFSVQKSVDMNQCHAPPHSLSLVEERSSSSTPPPSSPPPAVLKELPVIFKTDPTLQWITASDKILGHQIFLLSLNPWGYLELLSFPVVEGWVTQSSHQLLSHKQRKSGHFLQVLLVRPIYQCWPPVALSCLCPSNHWRELLPWV